MDKDWNKNVSKLKSKRNKLYHNMKMINEETAQLSMGLAKLVSLDVIPKSLAQSYEKFLSKYDEKK